MRFMFIWKPGKPMTGPPSPEAHKKLIALIEEGTKAGTFLGTDGATDERRRFQGHRRTVYRNEGARRRLRDHAFAKQGRCSR